MIYQTKQTLDEKNVLLLVTASIFLACNNETTTTKSAISDTTVARETLNLPYTVDVTPEWELGDASNVAIAMNTLRAYE